MTFKDEGSDEAEDESGGDTGGGRSERAGEDTDGAVCVDGLFDTLGNEITEACQRRHSAVSCNVDETGVNTHTAEENARNHV